MSTYEAKVHRSRILAEVETTGQPITIGCNTKPVVHVVPHRRAVDPLQQDSALQGARFRGDPRLAAGLPALGVHHAAQGLPALGWRISGLLLALRTLAF